MQAGERSTAMNCWQNPLRNCAQRPKPGAISRIVEAGRYLRTRGNSEAHHSTSVPPQFADQRSPSSLQPSGLPHKDRFCSTVGIFLFYRQRFSGSVYELTGENQSKGLTIIFDRARPGGGSPGIQTNHSEAVTPVLGCRAFLARRSTRPVSRRPRVAGPADCTSATHMWTHSDSRPGGTSPHSASAGFAAIASGDTNKTIFWRYHHATRRSSRSLGLNGSSILNPNSSKIFRQYDSVWQLMCPPPPWPGGAAENSTCGAAAVSCRIRW